MKAIYAGYACMIAAVIIAGGIIAYEVGLSHKNQDRVEASANFNFNFAQISKRQDARWRAWHWYELTDEQYEKLTAALKTLPEGDRKPVKVACSDADCRALAEDVVDAFKDARWTVELYAVPYQTQVGLWCSGIPACQAVTAATGIKTVPYDGPKDTVMLVFGPKK